MTDNPLIHMGANGGPPLLSPFDLVSAEINDLYDEAHHWADGEPISTPEMHDAISSLHDQLGDAGKRAEAMRVAEKKPLDDLVDAVQARFNPLIQVKNGKVALAKESLGTLLTAWRVRMAAEARAKADAAIKEAEALRAQAQEEMRASSGNLEARERAEETVETAKEAAKFARRTEKAATTGTGLRTNWVAVLVDPAVGLQWAWEYDGAAFEALATDMAQTAARSGVRTIPGFEVVERKVAA